METTHYETGNVPENEFLIQQRTEPQLVFRGEYDANASYCGNEERVDIVRWDGEWKTYYVARSDAGEFAGKPPTNTTYWDVFAINYE